jgi:hypothetical protein
LRNARQVTEDMLVNVAQENVTSAMKLEMPDLYGRMVTEGVLGYPSAMDHSNVASSEIEPDEKF